MKGLTASLYRIAGVLVLTSPLWINGCGKEEPTQKTPAQPKTTKPAAASEAAPQAPTDVPQVVYRYNPEGRRDPFRSLLAQETAKKNAVRRDDLPPLQRFGVEEFVLGGITWDEKSAMALVKGPDGKAYILKPGILLGPNGGVVKKITPSAVEVHEKAADYRGRVTDRVIMLELHKAEEDKK